MRCTKCNSNKIIKHKTYLYFKPPMRTYLCTRCKTIQTRPLYGNHPQ